MSQRVYMWHERVARWERGVYAASSADTRCALDDLNLPVFPTVKRRERRAPGAPLADC